MAYVGGFVNLFSLNLSDCPRINNSTLWPITGVYLSSSDFDDDDEKCRFVFFFFSGLTCLKELDLSRCSKVKDAGIKHLQSVVNLEKLWISQTGVKEAGISLLASLKKLSLLDLGGLPVTDHNLSSLQVYGFILGNAPWYLIELCSSVFIIDVVGVRTLLETSTHFTSIFNLVFLE